MFIFHLSFASSTSDPSCRFFAISLDCDLSGWMKFLIGDIGIGLFLAVLLHTLNHRNHIEIQSIIQSQEMLRKKRLNYALSHMKNVVKLIMHTISAIKGSANQYNLTLALQDKEKRMWLETGIMSKLRADEAKLGRLLQSTRLIMVASNDVLEPEVVNRVEGVLNFIAEITAEEGDDGMMQFPKSQVCRVKLEYLLDLLSNYHVSPTPPAKIIEKPQEKSAEITNSVSVELKG